MPDSPVPNPQEPIIHPLVDFCLKRLQQGPAEGDRFLLDRSSLEGLGVLLGKVSGRDLAIAARELILFARHLDVNLESPAAADVVLEVLLEEKARLTALGPGAADVVGGLENAAERARAAATVGNVANSRPVDTGEPPAGSFKAGPGAQLTARGKRDKP